ncbi:MAG: glycoside hydrolase family 16 protein [Psychromonas sp.]
MESILRTTKYIPQQRVKYKTRMLSSLTSLLLLSFSAPTIAGWEVQWIDKFEGTVVNWDNWTAQTNAYYNAEEQCYTDDDSSTNKNYDVYGGTLKIIARKQNINCPGLGNAPRSWTSGRLNGKDKQEFLYGRIESKIRFHNLEGGTWPAFWMLENRIGQQPIAGDGDSSDWPYAGAGEIDVWEWFSNKPDTYITNFFNGMGENMSYNNGCGSLVLYEYPNGGADVQNWHTYAMEWTKDNISFYIDDKQVASQDVSNCSQYEEPMFVLLNVAIGGKLGGNIDTSLQKATMEIDYVAHCQPTDGNNATYCNEELADEDNGLLKVNINMVQNGQSITDINPNNGLVTLTAKSSNTIENNSYSYDWYTERLPSPIAEGNQVTFDPSSMEDGNYYTSVTLTDDQSPALTDRDALTLKVVSAPRETPSSSSDSSGGSLNQILLSCLALLCLFRRRFNLI